MVDAAGSESSVRRCVELARPAADLVLLGWDWQRIVFPGVAIASKELVIRATMTYGCQAGGRDVDLAAELLAGSPEIAKAVVTHRFPLDEAPRAFEVAQDRRGGRAAEELDIPFVASGGQADGRSLVASLAMGADGMNMGTRFMATVEAPIHQNVKEALVEATELDTRLIMRPLRNTERVLVNASVERVLEKEKELGAKITFEDIAGEVGGVYPKIMQDGEMDAGPWSCGMVAGLIHDIPTCKELIDRIMAEAEDIVRGRLEGFLTA